MKKLFTKRRIISFAVIAAVVIVPLLYSFFYLGAFWDPYSRLETLPVAVVNKDEGATINDVERNLGQEMCDTLKEDASLKYVFTDEEDAKKGTEGKDYYAMIVIPENFSESIASASTDDKQTATITYSPNEKRNFLASQILNRAVLQVEESLRGKIDKEIVQELADNIKAVPDQMTELQDGLSKIKDGASELTEGTQSLADGSATFYDKFGDYADGITSAKEGSSSLANGATDLDNGIKKLQDGANQLVTATTDLDQLTSGAKTLAEGAKSFNDGLIQYTAGVDTLISSINDTQTFLQQYVTKINPSIMKDSYFSAFITKMSDPTNAQSITALQAASTSLKEASAQISAGAAQLSTGTKNLPELRAGLATLSAGITKAKEGSAALSNGAGDLYTGLSKINDATAKLSAGAKDLADGSSDLNSGASELSDGITTAKSGVDNAITDTNNQLSALDGIADYAEAPVSIQQDNVTSIANYGTAFAPYFMSLSLWVGALILFVGVYLDTEGKFKILSRASEHKVARSFIYLLIGLIQAFALAYAIKYGLGLEVDSTLLYYGSCCLVSLVFISIVQFLMVHLKDVGKLLPIVLLILQLTSCGGTFPMETVPKFFNILYPYMPMTYSVELFKQAITDANSHDVIYNGGILFAILVAFMSLTILFSIVKQRKAEKTDFTVPEQIY
ncbi:MAG TPA: YhgE/Pip domain-containing protein [Mobilitalea sp.]|nr:YhgE/Pip domain-containing protein [Mobilitalea sp.]